MRRWFLISLVVLTSFIGCNIDMGDKDSATPEDEAASKDESIASKEPAYEVYLVNVDQLRLRRYGDVKSEMLTALDENAPLYFLGEETDYTESIGGHTGSWKRVRTLDGAYEGWIFGADHFAEPWLTKSEILALQAKGKSVDVFSNLSTKELAELTGANFDASPRGSRYTGYYTYNTADANRVIDGQVVMRTRIFDQESKEVKFIPCTLEVQEGMPTEVPDCTD